MPPVFLARITMKYIESQEHDQIKAGLRQARWNAAETLGEYCNKRVIELGFGTKALKHTFPFHIIDAGLVSFRKLSVMVHRYILKRLPFAENYQILLINSYKSYIRIYIRNSPAAHRYISKIRSDIDKSGLPLSIHYTPNTVISNSDATVHVEGTIVIFSFINDGKGALLVHYLPEIAKVLLNLSRFIIDDENNGESISEG